jgi:AcrR family transcriptional regulator
MTNGSPVEKKRSASVAVPRLPSVASGHLAFDRDAQRQLKRDAVLRVAASSFNRKGFANTSMDDVAKTLGISKPTLYQYFERKEDILYECHELSMRHAEACLAIATDSEGSGLEKLLLFFRGYIGGLLGELGSCPVLTNVDSLSPDRREEVVERRAQISAAARAFITTGIEDGSVVHCSPALGALFTLGAVNWIPLWYREDGASTPDEIVEAFMGFLRASLTSAPHNGGTGQPAT